MNPWDFKTSEEKFTDLNKRVGYIEFFLGALGLGTIIVVFIIGLSYIVIGLSYK